MGEFPSDEELDAHEAQSRAVFVGVLKAGLILIAVAYVLFVLL